ncbi:MAG TPA: hypothetical protein VFW83_03520, partial [Bryobacteraceae bacterium]|nr:hypothetical protein [Bryobacteraceae bacterium]
GLPDAGSSLLNLIYTSIRATPHPGVLGTKIGAGALAWGVLPPALIMIAAQSYWVWRYRPKARAQLIPAIALAAAGLGMLTAHRVFGLLYPVDRIGLPIELLAAMAWALAAGSARWKWLIAANVALGGVMAIQFLTQFETGYFQTWWYDASTKKVAQLLRDETRGRPPGSISVGATWIHQPALEFYRNLYRIAALKPVERRQPTLLSGQDYYVLNDPDTKSPAAGNLTTLFSDSFSGIVLARPGVSK